MPMASYANGSDIGFNTDYLASIFIRARDIHYLALFCCIDASAMVKYYTSSNHASSSHADVKIEIMKIAYGETLNIIITKRNAQ